jgi:two-component system, LytTR family, sensor kinase
LPLNRRLRFALLIFLAWTIYGAVIAQQTYIARLYSDHSPSWLHAILDSAAYVYLWALFTPLIVYLGEKRPLVAPFSWSNAIFHFAAAVVLSFVSQCLVVLQLSQEYPLRYPVPDSAALFRTAFIMTDYGLTYWVILLIQQSLRSLNQRNAAQLRASQLQSQLAGAQLQALKMQLHPHFLFNALHSVSELIHQDPNMADRMLALISDLLRTFLQASETQEVRLEEEIGVLARYIEIQKIRFEDRVHFRIEIPPSARDAMVPSLILQPIMENAVLHGIAHREKNGLIEIAARRENGSLHISVSDNGNPVTSKSPDEFVEGMGLRNTRRRLHAIYGSDHQFVIGRSRHGGVEAAFTIPFHTQSGAGD